MSSLKGKTILIILLVGIFLVSAVGASMLYKRFLDIDFIEPERKQEITSYDLVFKGGEIVDGSGKKGYRADLGIVGERIVKIGTIPESQGKRVQSIEGMVIAPGFINPHSHIDQSILEDRNVGPSLLQGITTEIVGMDGQSAIELDRHFDQVFAGGGIGVNYGSFVGQGSVRRAVIGEEDKNLTPAELNKMKAIVEKAMQEGAFGLSTGLEYPPGYQTPTWEIIELAKVAESRGGIYSTHMRDEGSEIQAALEEALQIGAEARMPINISHLKITGGTNDIEVAQRLTEQVIEKISKVQKQGQEVFADLYPYTTTYFKVNVPLAEVYGSFPDHTIFISKSSQRQFLDRSLTDIAKKQNTSVQEVVQLLSQDNDVRAYVQNLSEKSLQTFLKQDYVMIGVDAPTESPKGVEIREQKLHPRRYGTYPRVFGRYVREEKILTLEEAVRKMTGLVAENYRLPERGLIKEGNLADLVVFDANSILDQATFSNPMKESQGIKFVVVNGKVAVENGKLTGVKAGQLVKPKYIKN